MGESRATRRAESELYNQRWISYFITSPNAMAESFFAALKNERVHRTEYPTREHARRDVVRYIEFWYNSKRRHSGLQYRTPRQVREEYLERQSAA
jgi:putative transposase